MEPDVNTNPKPRFQFSQFIPFLLTLVAFAAIGGSLYYSMVIKSLNRQITALTKPRNAQLTQEIIPTPQQVHTRIVKTLKFKGINLNIYTYSDQNLDGIYYVKQENSPSSDWGKDGSYSYAVISTKSPLYGDENLSDIAGNKLVSINAISNSISIYAINDQFQQEKTFTPLKTLQLPTNFSGVPFAVKCGVDLVCTVNTAWHFEGGCTGKLDTTNFSFTNISCGEGYR